MTAEELIAKWRAEATEQRETADEAEGKNMLVTAAGLQHEAEATWKCADELEAVLRAAAPRAQRDEWRLDDRGRLDDVVVEDVATFRLERMSHACIWGAVYRRDGSRTTFNICGDSNARVTLNYEHEGKPPVSTGETPPQQET